MPSAKDWTPEKIVSWVHGFIETFGEIPRKLDMDKGGPGAKHRKLYGGVAGVLTLAGISVVSAGVKRYWDRESIKKEVQTWAEEHAPEHRAPTKMDLIEARALGRLAFEPNTILNHYDSVHELFVDIGLIKDAWTAQECVQFARLLRTDHGRGHLLKQVQKYGNPGKTPTFDDIERIYPNTHDLMHYRVNWENWQPLKKRPPLTACWIGYATLALARADGDTAYIAKEMDAMAKIGIGPGYHLGLIGELGQGKDDTASGIWLQDQAVVIYEGLTHGERDGSYLNRVHPIFMPELKDVGLVGKS